MKASRHCLLVARSCVLPASPAFADARSDAKSQVEFGINVAQRGLWREAIYRWEKAVELDPTYAAAFNDLAIAYEHEGQLDKARKAYEKALELDPNNAQIRQNYELFKEINDRAVRRKTSSSARARLRCAALRRCWPWPAAPTTSRSRSKRRSSPSWTSRAFQRVLVAGFVAGGNDDVDANQETVRLLRSQLRTKSSLQVIDADVDAAASTSRRTRTRPRRQRAAANRARPRLGRQAAPTAAPPASRSALPQKIKEEKDLEPYERLFANTAYWKTIGEEYQNPLIVTGTVLFTPHVDVRLRAARTRKSTTASAAAACVPVRTYMERKGFILRPKFVFIDGRTGATMYSESYREEMLYNAQQNTPALSSYFELMDRLVPNFLSALSSQKIKGTRVLLK